MTALPFLPPEAIIPTLKVSGKKQLLQELASRGSQLSGLPEPRIHDQLVEREALGSTGTGEGIALPHARFRELTRIHGLFARLDKPIPFDAVDGQPVDLVFLILSPEEGNAVHLKALAEVSRRLRDRDLCERLRGSTNREALYALLTGWEVASQPPQAVAV
ncbi:MAG: PTS sugar transporter subunit IIA [Alphaproteobacteria bacterium]|nr:PTS sugar transporter subunit IIA [Alphaproteobacteria bacterium]